jgi:hypothetical protein
MSNLAPILSLARAGATGRAWNAFVAQGQDKAVNDPQALTLKGRLLKDKARRAEVREQAPLYLKSAQAYADAAALRPDSYPLINAATMSLFAGQERHVELLAKRVLALLQTGRGVGETPYWHEATKAEALLLLRQQEEAEVAFMQGVRHAPAAWEDHATTLRQFRAILEYRDEPHDWLAAYAPPKSIYFKGIMGIAPDDLSAVDSIATQLAATGARFAYGALAAGGDILVAEAMLRLCGELHVVLPIMPSVFKARSVAPYGDDWSRRFDALFEQAASIEIVEQGDRLSLAGIQLAAEVAKGRAIDNAARLESEAVLFEIAGADARRSPGRTAHLVSVSRSAGSDTEQVLEQRHIAWWIATNATDLSADFDWANCGAVAVCHMAHREELAPIVSRVRELDPDAVMAIQVAVTDHNLPAESEAAQLQRMVQSATPGTTIATATAAMAIKALHRQAWIEPLGELMDLNGALSVYALGRFDGAISTEQ